MTAIFAATILLAFIALGELISLWSKARVPALLIAMLGTFIAVQLNIIPDTIIDDSYLPQIYAILVAPLLFHMGSLIPLKTMLAQWRSVVISFAGMIVAVGVIAAVVGPIFGFQYVVAGAGPLAGGIVSTGLTTDGLKAANVDSAIVVLPALVLMLQSLPSMPLTNLLLRKFAIHLRDSGDLEELARNHKKVQKENGGDKKLVNLPQMLVDNELFILFLILVGGSLATLLAIPTHIPSSIIALVLGVASTAIGLTPERSMEKSSSFGIAMASVVAIVMAPLVAASLSDVLAALIPVAVILAVGAVGIMIGGAIATKLLKWKTTLGMSVALTAMYGFPADYLLTNEVVRSVGRTEEERDALREAMLPAMLVGGFTSVSAGSVVIASVLVSFL
ncbi:hypothetical protein QP572_01125 [Brevibacterium sp. UMB10442]|uniref:hypothetical protein n=1 Tax=Brevibacterium sp. UMB1308A TaxID=3050608 RepID=UPI00254DCFEB|nr:hypothetical protein [Brevibacterium sp. UMB1308A]MDK7748960.1 hypothetical protein [Brevibacterium sp. UMB10442]MDK8345651.1 hypothetical protein [Brevibacterium sp. UMB1308B]MDK8713253.1 hypothetical protein [Brevibacterium sp. UMB1308A]